MLCVYVCVTYNESHNEPQTKPLPFSHTHKHTLLQWHCLGLNVTFNSCTLISSCVDTLEEETRKHSAAI